MNIKLEQKLYKKYPKLFKQRRLPITHSAMGFGCQHGDGWYWLLDNLCNYLQFQIDKNGEKQIDFNTIKEKYGYLRIYTDSISKEMDSVIDFAEFLSGKICENCGSTDDVRDIGSSCYVQRYCKKCREYLNKEKKR